MHLEESPHFEVLEYSWIIIKYIIIEWLYLERRPRPCDKDLLLERDLLGLLERDLLGLRERDLKSYKLL